MEKTGTFLGHFLFLSYLFFFFVFPFAFSLPCLWGHSFTVFVCCFILFVVVVWKGGVGGAKMGGKGEKPGRAIALLWWLENKSNGECEKERKRPLEFAFSLFLFFFSFVSGRALALALFREVAGLSGLAFFLLLPIQKCPCVEEVGPTRFYYSFSSLAGSLLRHRSPLRDFFFFFFSFFFFPLLAFSHSMEIKTKITRR